MPELWAGFRRAIIPDRVGDKIDYEKDQLGVPDNHNWFVGIPRPLVAHTSCPLVTSVKATDNDAHQLLVDSKVPLSEQMANDLLLLVGVAGWAVLVIFGNEIKAPFIWKPLFGGTHHISIEADQNDLCQPKTAIEDWEIKRIRCIIAQKFISLGSWEGATSDLSPAVRVGATKKFSGRFLSPRNLTEVLGVNGTIAPEFSDSKMISEATGIKDADFPLNGRTINVFSKSVGGSKKQIGYGTTDNQGNWSADCKFDEVSTTRTSLPDVQSLDVLRITAEFAGDSIYEPASMPFFTGIIVLPRVAEIIPSQGLTYIVDEKLLYETTDRIQISGKLVELDFSDKQLTSGVVGETVKISFISAKSGGEVKELTQTVTSGSGGIIDATYLVSNIVKYTGITGPLGAQLSQGHFKMEIVSTKYKQPIPTVTRTIWVGGMVRLTVQVSPHELCGTVGKVAITGKLTMKGPSGETPIPGKTITIQIGRLGMPADTTIEKTTDSSGAFNAQFTPTACKIIGEVYRVSATVKDTPDFIPQLLDNAFVVYPMISTFKNIRPAAGSQLITQVGEPMTIDGNLIGICLDTTQSPLKSRTVTLTRNGNPYQATTDANGYFKFDFTIDKAVQEYILAFSTDEQCLTSISTILASLSFPLGRTDLSLTTDKNVVKNGDPITLTGKLVLVSPSKGRIGIPNETVKILNTTNIIEGELITSVTTDASGNFQYKYTPPKIGIYSILAIFEGNEKFLPCKSSVHGRVDAVSNLKGDYECPIDHQTFPTWGDLQKHLQEHIGGDVGCPSFLPWGGPGSIIQAIICRITGGGGSIMGKFTGGG